MLSDTLKAYMTDDTISESIAMRSMGGGEAYVAQIEQAQRYVLDRSAVRMLQDMTLLAPERFLAMLPVCRMPQPLMWIEMDFNDRSGWIKDNADTLAITPFDGSSPPSRLGFLIRQSGERGEIMNVHCSWAHSATKISLGYLAIRIDLSEDFAYDEAEVKRGIAEYAADPDGIPWTRKPIRSHTSFEAAARLGQRTDYVKPLILADFWEGMRRANNPALTEEIYTSAYYDLASEWRFVLALLAIMNSRNVIEVEPGADHTKINKARLQKGKPPLMDHQNVTLSLTKAVKRYAKEHKLDRKAMMKLMEAQFVRGHFKTRKTGIFWWSPHGRMLHLDMPTRPVINVTA